MDAFNQKWSDIIFSAAWKVDFIWHSYDFTSNDIIDLASCDQFWGQGLEKPYIALENLSITPKEVTLMSKDKNPTLKIQLANGVSIIKFKSSEEEYESLTPNPSGSVNINIVGTCSINEWNGIITPQILVSDYEIVSEMKYYF